MMHLINPLTFYLSRRCFFSSSLALVTETDKPNYFHISHKPNKQTTYKKKKCRQTTTITYKARYRIHIMAEANSFYDVAEIAWNAQFYTRKNKYFPIA